MNRQPGSLSRPARHALGASMTAMMCVACAGVGPPVVEHPRSGAMTAVAPESDPLAGAVTFRPGERPPPIASAPARPMPSRAARALSLPTRADLTARTARRVTIQAGAFDLALGDASGEAPDVALSEALSLSSGPAPSLEEPGVAILHVSEAALEEGAWEASRR